MSKTKEPINNGTSHNMLSVGTKIIGNIFTENDIRIDGELEGDVACSSKIILGTTGVITGSANCANAEIMGKIEGKIVASELVSLKASSHFKGEIATKLIAIEPGATFTGTLKTDA
ncbi:MAG: polymer-forming cytoskeletal protein [Prevotellaceae bacterium]|jgi:cytoskeletal protein CcmA (bactofilin family)|nr:polymer-forming cytoskeletal protein [Prevotellaceae bacterium]